MALSTARPFLQSTGGQLRAARGAEGFLEEAAVAGGAPGLDPSTPSRVGPAAGGNRGPCRLRAGVLAASPPPGPGEGAEGRPVRRGRLK